MAIPNLIGGDFLQLKIANGVVELSGEPILNQVDIEINDYSKIGIVGRNGCGKTTLLKLIAGEHSIVKRDSDNEAYYSISGKATIGTLSQMTFEDKNRTLLEEIRSAYSEILNIKCELELAQSRMEENQSEENIKKYTNLLDLFTNLGGFYFEREYEAAIKQFGFSNDEKMRKLNEFSGGQRTKIAFLKLLLSKPDILLLDEPTNHLDVNAVMWLEEYLRDYKKAFVVVSHDRMFLNNVVETIYEIEYGKTHKYNGNYSSFVEQKKALFEQRKKAYDLQKKEIARLKETVERFRYKPTKAAMAQSKLKQIERMAPIEPVENYDNRAFKGIIIPDDIGVKDMLSVKDLKIGFDDVLSTVNLDVKLGNRIGIIGGNGLGKSTFIKTLMGIIPAIDGEYKFASRAKVGYFDQQMAQYHSKKTILEDFLGEFPQYNDYEARSALGAFLFSGEDVFKTVDMLSGGERVRLALCKIFGKKPNFLILDEPTNHMDIVGKEALEKILLEYSGTILFVSHDRYFISKIANSVLVFDEGKTEFFPYGYLQYCEAKQKSVDNNNQEIKIIEKKDKKTFTTPLKEEAKRKKALSRCEEKIALCEKTLFLINEELQKEENASDYQKLDDLSKQLATNEELLLSLMEEWEALSD